MERWSANLLGGAATVVELSPPPVRHRFGRRFLDRSIEDAFRQDVQNVARDMNAAIAVVYGKVPHDSVGRGPTVGQRGGVSGPINGHNGLMAAGTADDGPNPARGFPPVVVGPSRWSGPLPPPDVLHDYEAVYAELSDTRVRERVAEAEHRRGMETRVLDAEIADSHSERSERVRGQHHALTIGIVAIVGSVVAVGLGHGLAGGLIGGGGVAGLVAVFIPGRAANSHGRNEPATAALSPDGTDRPR